MPIERVPSWAVAWALMYLEGGAWHYESLTRRVLATGISELGKRGGGTPQNTLRTDIITRHRDIFDFSVCRGYYEILNKNIAVENSSVQAAIGRLVAQYFDEYQRLLFELVYYGRRYSPERLRNCEARIKDIRLFLQRAADIAVDEDRIATDVSCAYN